MWFHKFLAERGYCNNKIPKLGIRIREEGKIFYHYKINSFTFNNLNWIYNMFYIRDDLNNQTTKIVPSNLMCFFSPLAIAIWFMDDGSKTSHSVKIATNGFTHSEVYTLCNLFQEKYNIICSVQKGGKDKGYVLYVSNKSLESFRSLVKPYMLRCMLYKLGI